MLHPVAWWLWGGGLVVAASHTTNPLLLLILVVVAGWVVAERREIGAVNAYLPFLLLGLAAIVLRVALVARARERRHRTHRAVPAADGPAARVDGRRPARRAGVRGGVGGRRRRGTAARHDVGVHRGGQRAGQPETAAAVPPGDPLRRRHGRGRRADVRPAARRPGRAGCARRDACVGTPDRAVRSWAASSGRCSKAHWTDPSTSPRRWSPVATAARRCESTSARRVASALTLTGLVGVRGRPLRAARRVGTGLLGMPLLVLGVLVTTAALVVGARRDVRSRYRRDPWGGRSGP